MTDGPTLKRRDDRVEPGATERVIMAVSLAFTLALVSYVAYEALTTPSEARPHAEVESVEPYPGGGVLVMVVFQNPGGVGLLYADVSVDCAEPPPTLQFTNVPVDDVRRGAVVCPPGTTEARATVTAFAEA